MRDDSQHEAEDCVVEGPSATTSRENESSGPMAYVIFGVTAALLALASLAFSGCAGAISRYAMDRAEAEGESQDHHPDDQWLEEDEDWLFEEYLDLFDSPRTTSA